MDISRVGAERNRGIRTIVSDLALTSTDEKSWKNNLKWNSYQKRLEIRPRWVPFDGYTHHNYTISLTLDDVSALIETLGVLASEKNAADLRDHLGNHIPAIVKILACATGVAPIPIEGGDKGE